jgi:hypothetical protein
MKRLASVVATIVLAAILSGSNAYAFRGVEWCAEDPVFHVLGTTVAVTTYVHAPADAVTSITYIVEVPSNAGDVRVNYPGGRKIPTTVDISYSGAAYTSGAFAMNVSVTVTGPDGRETRTQVSGKGVADATYTGTTNTTQPLPTITVTTK